MQCRLFLRQLSAVSLNVDRQAVRILTTLLKLSALTDLLILENVNDWILMFDALFVIILRYFRDCQECTTVFYAELFLKQVWKTSIPHEQSKQSLNVKMTD